MSNYLRLEDLEVYRISLEYGKLGWNIYSGFNWRIQKVMGDQMIRSVDSVAANIAEGYGRFHYLDKNKFYYNARGSLLESSHWFTVMEQRELIDKQVFDKSKDFFSAILVMLNKLINSQLKRKNK